MKTDILIIGGGLSAYAAAYEIIKNSDLNVTMLAPGGGVSPYIHGFCLPIGEGDSEELFYEDTVASGYGVGDKTLIRRLCKDSFELPKWFDQLGLTVDEKRVKSLGSSAARIAGIGNNTGPVVMQAIHKRLPEDRVTWYNYRALKLLKENGRVVGARCYRKDTDSFENIYAGGVILATGGFGRLFPESTNSADIGGDGCAMASLAGCRLRDMEFIQFEPSAAVWPPQLSGKSIITTMFYEGAVLRGGDGNRFMDEKVGKDVQAKAIAQQIMNGNTTPHGGLWFDATAVPAHLWDTVYKPYLDRYLKYGIDMREEPVEIAPAAHTTCGGVVIDEDCRTEVPGLIACGEVTGGLHGANRLGGNAGLEVMVFGRIAGKTAIEEYKNIAIGNENVQKNIAQNVDAQRTRLQQLLRSALGVIRTEETMQKALLDVMKLCEHLQDHEDSYESWRLYNDAVTAKYAFESAIARKNSLGCHEVKEHG